MSPCSEEAACRVSGAATWPRDAERSKWVSSQKYSQEDGLVALTFSVTVTFCGAEFVGSGRTPSASRSCSAGVGLAEDGRGAGRCCSVRSRGGERGAFALEGGAGSCVAAHPTAAAVGGADPSSGRRPCCLG